jgi:hypothetical protein
MPGSSPGIRPTRSTVRWFNATPRCEIPFAAERPLWCESSPPPPRDDAIVAWTPQNDAPASLQRPRLPHTVQRPQDPAQAMSRGRNSVTLRHVCEASEMAPPRTTRLTHVRERPLYHLHFAVAAEARSSLAVLDAGCSAPPDAAAPHASVFLDGWVCLRPRGPRRDRQSLRGDRSLVQDYDL